MLDKYLNKITCGDSYELIKDIPDKSIDLIITDPPYELETRGAGFHNKRVYYDEIHDKGLASGITDEMLKEFLRVLKAVNIYIFCNKNQLRQYFNFFKDYNCDLLIWHKTNPIPTVNNKYLSDIEYCFFARSEGVKVYGDYTTLSKLYQSQVNKKDKDLFEHLTCKPIGFIKNLIKNSSLENEIIFDPFVGSGSTCVAAKELNRQYIGIEIEPKWAKVAENRLNGIDAHGQISMFLR